MNFNKKPYIFLHAYLGDERLHNAALVGHVPDHLGHVVGGGADERGPEHDRQVVDVHLGGHEQHLVPFEEYTIHTCDEIETILLENGLK